MNVNIPPTPQNPANKYKDDKHTEAEKNEDSTRPLNSVDTNNIQCRLQTAHTQTSRGMGWEGEVLSHARWLATSSHTEDGVGGMVRTRARSQGWDGNVLSHAHRMEMFIPILVTRNTNGQIHR